VIRVSPDGQNVAAIKRAFAAAAKVLNGSVETRNGEDGTILVKWSSSPRVRGRRGAGAQKTKPQHSEADVDREARRLHSLKSSDSYESLPADERRKLNISAKRNLSRRG
jgi:hypothetical protein